MKTGINVIWDEGDREGKIETNPSGLIFVFFGEEEKATLCFESLEEFESWGNLTKDAIDSFIKKYREENSGNY